MGESLKFDREGEEGAQEDTWGEHGGFKVVFLRSR